jgi:hypothetical protein
MDDIEDESEVDAVLEAAIEGVIATAVVSMIGDVVAIKKRIQSRERGGCGVGRGGGGERERSGGCVQRT